MLLLWGHKLRNQNLWSVLKTSNTSTYLFPQWQIGFEVTWPTVRFGDHLSSTLPSIIYSSSQRQKEYHQGSRQPATGPVASWSDISTEKYTFQLLPLVILSFLFLSYFLPISLFFYFVLLFLVWKMIQGQYLTQKTFEVMGKSQM